ncbi:Cellulose synthase catalytic subunit [UDP-forming] [Thalassovita autumnalis]|uniref:Cellulose synthase catalytic subunit [UDP-forming] n=1 Tax=Thalassovita autumnalis TaxID=2072972 RepID=A0A0P1GCU5_9RHOB|nr:glycosyltransferase [Thalassovita autumnalis]CUH68363.1 Cellulose synthase catalytic subunit [UDP-forming] [Thalassovita autumnalis]CUH73480.1 Cellulose synthase catalytic subunit [UDP-forming] [Thalassovita autumnalis]
MVLHHPKSPPKVTSPRYGQYLLDRGIISASQLLWAQGQLIQTSLLLGDVLVSAGILSNETQQEHYANWLGLERYPSPNLNHDPALLNRFDPHRCLQMQVLPLWQEAGVTHLAVAHPEQFRPDALRADLHPSNCKLYLGPRSCIQDTLIAHQGPRLCHAASHRTALDHSCRRWGQRPLRRTLGLASVPLFILVALSIAPLLVLASLTCWAIFTQAVASLTKSLALLAHLGRNTKAKPLPTTAPSLSISILVPLYKEPEVLPALIQRLSRLDYPRELMEVLVLLEECDHATREVIEQIALPDWIRPLVVPDGTPRTKPRAMNYALDVCEGEVIGIYDAEDAPAPDQLRQVAHAMTDAPSDLAGVQGVLDYYNAGRNWIARCFTIEYASWFRLILPGMRRLGFAIPLGGTTVFCRRDALLRVGGWDAHNVTEDADLGIRLARFGYRVELLPSTTEEEANCRPLPWVRQRSRWLKGYLATYLVHMRQPIRLFRDLGPRQFLGVQLHFITALSQFFLAPLLWSFWLVPLGLSHPLEAVVPPIALTLLAAGFITVELLTITIGIIATRAAHLRHLILWVPSLHLYYPMAVLAAYKALAELIFAPFYWDKTQHGISPPTQALRGSGQAAVAPRVELQPGGEGL